MSNNINVKELLDQLVPTIVKAVRLSLSSDYNITNQSLNNNVLKPEHLSGHIPVELQRFVGPLPTSSERDGNLKNVRKAFTTSLREIRAAHLPE